MALRFRSPLALVLLLLASASAAQELPRRVTLGVQLAPVTPAVQEALSLPDAGGVHVQGVGPGTVAAAGGVLPGDVIRRVDGAAVPDVPAFLSRLREARDGDAWRLAVRRGHEDLALTVRHRAVPSETAPEARVEYGAVEAQGALRRTILTVPEAAGPHPAVLLLGGVGCYSLDFAGPSPHPYKQLLDGLSAAGYATMRVEKSGVGDSQGAPCPTVDFETEVAGYRAGLAALRQRPDVDADRIVLLGHSMGGLIAPILAAETPVQGLAAIETSGLPWFEYLVDNSRRQLALEGRGPAEVDSTMREAIEATYRLYVAGEAPEQLFAERPEWQALVALPMHVSYMRQVAAENPAARWLAADAPALLVAGGADFVTSVDEHRHLHAVIEGARPGTATLAVIPDLDHFLSEAPDAAASFNRLKAGQPFSAFNTRLLPTLLDWLRQLPA